MQRFYEKNISSGEKYFFIEKSDTKYHQITKVLRLEIGNKIILFDGLKSEDLVYKIENIDKNKIKLSLVKNLEKKIKSNNKINLYQSIPNKQSKIEYILQKGVEVGINNFYFLKSKRSQNFNLTKNKLERFEKIIIEAVEQSNRNKVPGLFFLEKLNFKNIKGYNLYFHTQKENSISLKELNLKNKIFNIFIGPEGGFSNEEINDFKENNFSKIYLGDFILRTETAGNVIAFYILQNV